MSFEVCREEIEIKPIKESWKNAKKIKYRLEENKIMQEWEDYFNEVIEQYKKDKTK